MTLYRVLRDGMTQRVGAGWRYPKVGDLINVTDLGAAWLIADGWIEAAGGLVTQPTTMTVGEAGAEFVNITPQETEPEQ